ncbi:hypothetical protein M1O55_03715 [Dehalococcoidia bacterium]|nr:hypothetical protein [Dehalococcoidia bacterium]
MSRFKDARDRGCQHLLSQLHEDGSFGSPELGATEYYKVPAAFQVCGENNAANQLLNWVRRKGKLPDGDFVPRPPNAEFDYWYVYYNTWIVIGAQRLGQFDIAEEGMEFIMGFWDPESGGFYSSYDEREADTKEDLWVVSGCGQAALYTGRIDVARGVGRWMKRLMDDQPNYPSQLYSVYSLSDGLITESDTADDIRYVMSNDAERDQFFFHPGIAGGFLARLYQATDEEEWLDLARIYMRFAEGANDYLFKLLRAGKVGWAASVLYTLTDEDIYREMAIRIGDNIIEAQSEHGHWSDDTETDVASNDATAEMVVWLDEIYQAVGDG